VPTYFTKLRILNTTGQFASFDHKFCIIDSFTRVQWMRLLIEIQRILLIE